MSRPDPRQQAALSAALAGAVDLSALRARAEARATSGNGAQQQQQRPAGGASQWIIDVTDATFQNDVVERSLGTCQG